MNDFKKSIKNGKYFAIKNITDVDLLNNLEVYVSQYEANLYEHVCASVYDNQTVINGGD